MEGSRRGAFPRICGLALFAPSRGPGEILLHPVRNDPHLPAIAVAPPGARARMMAKPSGFVLKYGISVKFD